MRLHVRESRGIDQETSKRREGSARKREERQRKRGIEESPETQSGCTAYTPKTPRKAAESSQKKMKFRAASGRVGAKGHVEQRFDVALGPS
jgi:hypothetical protein